MNRLSSRIAVAAAGLTTLIAASAVQAVPLFSIGGNLGPSTFFGKSLGADGEVDVNTDLSGVIVNEFTFTTQFTIGNGATFEWSGNGLDTDTSLGGLASGSFLDGGTITITGNLFNYGAPVVTGGVILQGTLGGFSIQENVSADDFLDTGGALFTPTGGYLVNGTGTNYMPTDYAFAFSIIGAEQGGAGIQDFQDDVQFIQGTTWNMFVPEPSTFLMVAGLGVGVLVRRRK